MKSSAIATPFCNPAMPLLAVLKSDTELVRFDAPSVISRVSGTKVAGIPIVVQFCGCCSTVPSIAGTPAHPGLP